MKLGEIMRCILITIILISILISAVLCALAITSDRTQAAPALLSKIQAYIELSTSSKTTDTKPSGSYNGSTYYETDTGRTFIYSGSAWTLQKKVYSTAQSYSAAAGTKPGVAVLGYNNAAMIYGAGGSSISINFIVQGYISGISSWFNLSTANTTVTTAINDSSSVLIFSNIAYLDSIRVKTTAVSVSDTLYYKFSLFTP